MLVVLPLWPTQPWYPWALQLATSQPVALPENCLHLAHDPDARHPLEGRLHLAGWMLSGDIFEQEAFLGELLKSSRGPGGSGRRHSMTPPGANGSAGAHRGINIALRRACDL